MIERALTGDRRYWSWVAFLALVIGLGSVFYLRQLTVGLTITGLSRDVSWGFYIAQFTFLVGVAASAVMVVLPYYLHDFKAFSRVTILGEFLAIASVAMCVLFIMVDLGQPGRAFNMILHPSFRSVMFWDMLALSGYLLLNVLITRVTLGAQRRGEPPSAWIRPVIILSIPWAISIHTVTAFIYSGLAARPFWLTAILAPRFLASAFSSGPALLILLCLLVARLTRFDVGWKAIQTLATIVTYAMLINVFFVAVEIFTAFYSSIPEHMEHFQYLYRGLEGHNELALWMWASVTLALVALLLLLTPRLRSERRWLAVASGAVIVSIWIEKGLGMVVTGFVPTPLGKAATYVPTIPELLISVGVYCIGALMVTVFYKVALSMRDEVAAT